MEDYTQTRLNVFRNGYSPIPAIDKITTFKGWPTIEITEERIEAWDRIEGMTSTNLRIENGLAVIDFDVEHELVTQLYDELLEDYPELDGCLMRVGKAPKEAWFFRTEQPYPRLATPVYGTAEEPYMVESWGGETRRQFGAIGWHTLGERRYEWVEGASPETVPLEDLPVLPKSLIVEIMRQCAMFLEEHFERLRGREVEELAPHDVYDLTEDMVFATKEDGEVELEELRELAGQPGGHYYLSASFTGSAAAKNTRRCSATIDHHGGVAIWDSMTDITHHEARFEPRPIAEISRSAAERLRALAGENVLPEPQEVPPVEEQGLPGYQQQSTYLINNLHNARLLANEGDREGLFVYDAFMNNVVPTVNAPQYGLTAGNPLGPHDWTALTAEVQGEDQANAKMTKNMIMSGFTRAARQNGVINYMQTWLDDIEWDGRERVDDLIRNVFRIEPDTYHREVVTRWLVQAVDRAVNPGCQADHALILIGTRQGEGKSSFFRALSPEPRFHLELKGSDAKNADRIAYRLAAKWIVDFVELSALKGRDSEETKGFITLTHDSRYVLYEGAYEDQPRTCVFGGTTNDRHFLSDPTGNRRYWPIEVNVPHGTTMDVSWLRENRDQLWAEARAKHLAGYRTYVGEDEEVLAATVRRAQKDRVMQDPDIEIVMKYLRKVETHCSSREIWDECFTLQTGPMRTGPIAIQGRNKHKIQDLMHHLGWAQTKKIKGIDMWTRTDEASPYTDFEGVVRVGEGGKVRSGRDKVVEFTRRRKSSEETNNEKSPE